MCDIPFRVPCRHKKFKFHLQADNARREHAANVIQVISITLSILGGIGVFDVSFLAWC